MNRDQQGSARKLTLNHETLRNLEDRHSMQVAGGVYTKDRYFCSSLCPLH